MGWWAGGPGLCFVWGGGGVAGVATIEAERVLGEILGLLATG